MSEARYEVNYNGIYYDDINWDLELNSLGPNCPECGCDAAEGHGSSCYYLWYMMETTRGRKFLYDMIEEAVIRERNAGVRS